MSQPQAQLKISVSPPWNRLVTCLMFTLSLLMLAGCGGSSSSDDEGEVPVSDTPQSSISAVNEVVLADKGARLTLPDGANLSIPPGALSEDTEITMTRRSVNENNKNGTVVSLEPTGLKFDKPLTISVPVPKDLDPSLVEGFIYSDSVAGVEGQYELDKSEELLIDINNDMVSAEINHFSRVTFFGAQALYLTFAIPGKYLDLGDIEYNLSPSNKWATGHGRMHIGIKPGPERISLTPDDRPLSAAEKATALNYLAGLSQDDENAKGHDLMIHSYVNEDSGNPYLLTARGVHILSDSDYRNSRSNNIYMGAKRRSGLSWDERKKIVSYAIDKEGALYNWIGNGNMSLSESSYSCVGLIESSYEAADVDLTFERQPLNATLLNATLPIDQFESPQLDYVNEITVEEGEIISFPIYGVLRNKSVLRLPESYRVIAAEIENQTSDAVLATTEGGGYEFHWDTANKGRELPWQFTIKTSGQYDGEFYEVTRTLKVNVLSKSVSLSSPSNVIAAGAASPSGDSGVGLIWDSVPEALSYNVYYSTVAGTASNGQVIANVTDTTFTHTGLTNSTEYYYVVRAVGTGGVESLPSAEVSAVPSAPVTGPDSEGFILQVEIVGNGEVGVTGSDSENTGWGTNCVGSCSARVQPEPFNTVNITAFDPLNSGSDPAMFSPFIGWSGDGGCSGDQRECTLTLTEDTTVTAIFEESRPVSEDFSLQVEVIGNGEVFINHINRDGPDTLAPCGPGPDVCSTRVNSEEPFNVVHIIAGGDSSLPFIGWVGDGGCSGDQRECILTLTESTTVTAMFGDSLTLSN